MSYKEYMMPPGTVRSWIERSLALLIFVAAQQGAPAQTVNRGKQVSSVAQLLALAADPRTEFDVLQVSRFLGTLSTGERQSVERQLIMLPHEELIAGVLVDVLKTRDVGAAELIATHITGWKTVTQVRAIHIPAIARGPFLTIPRALLRDALSGARVAGSARMSDDPLGSACLVLANTGNPADLQTIQSAARLQPKSWGVWMALSYGDGMNPSVAALAQTVYQDTSLAIPLRVAAATALEAFDSKAAAYAVGQLQSYLTQFGTQDALAAAQDAVRASVPGRNGPGPAAIQYASFTNNLYMMSALLVLKSESAHQLTFQYLTAKNQVIRRLCGIVAARRWPADLLKTGRGLFSEEEYVKLMAVIAIYRSENAAAAASAAPSDKLTAAKARLTAGGLGGLLPDAGILSYF